LGVAMGQVGIGFSNALFGVRETIRYAKLAERKGLHSVWIAEDYFHRSAIPFLTSWATATTTIKIGVGVLPYYTRHIALTAMTFATIDELSNGRTILGIGAGDRVIATENLGYRMMSTVSVMRRFIEILRQLIEGKQVTYKSKFVRMKNVGLGVKPKRRIPIYLAANQTQMLRLAGEVADGVLLTNGTSPEHVSFAKEEVKVGAERVGRDLMSITVAPYITSAVSRDLNARLYESPLLRSYIAYCLAPRYGDLIAHLSGIDPDIVRAIRTNVEQRRPAEASSLVSTEIIKKLSAVGTPEEFRDRIAQYERAGGRNCLPIVFPIAGDVSLAIESVAK
jgi:5,10-methylenetetrahydromethanopterin reductase